MTYFVADRNDKRNPDNPRCTQCGVPQLDHYNGLCPCDVCGEYHYGRCAEPEEAK